MSIFRLQLFAFHLEETNTHKHEPDVQQHVDTLKKYKNRNDLPNEWFYEDAEKIKEIRNEVEHKVNALQYEYLFFKH